MGKSRIDDRCIVDWITANEARLWLDRVLVRDARRECAASLGVESVPIRQFRRCRFSCEPEHWLRLPRRKEWRRRDLSCKQWEVLRGWLTANCERVRSQSVEYVVALARSERIPCSVAILENSCTFKAMS